MLVIIVTHPIQYQVPLYRALAESGVSFEVWFLCSRGADEYFDEGFGKKFSWDINLLEGYQHRFLKVNDSPTTARFFGLRLQEDLNTLIKEKGVKALWIQGWQVFAYWQVLFQLKNSNIDIWLRAESNSLKRNYWPKSFIRKFLLKWFFSKIDKFLYIGSLNKELYLNHGVPLEKLFYAPYFVDNAKFSKEYNELEPFRLKFRKTWNIPSDVFCFLFVGKLIPKKRPEDLIKAAKIVSRKHKIHLLFVGSGSLEETLKSQVSLVYNYSGPKCRENAGSLSASFVGFLNQSKIVQAYVAADALVLPSDFNETWGLVVNEAMACGVPAVVSDQCGCAKDLVAPLSEDLVFRCADVSDLSSAMIEIVNGKPSSKEVKSRISFFTLERTVSLVRELMAS